MEKSDGRSVVDVHRNSTEETFEKQLIKVLVSIDDNVRTLIAEVREDKEMKKEARSAIDELQTKIETFKNSYSL